MFNDISSILGYLHSRRSGRARDMVAPGPDDTQMRRILQAAMRTPDHGKLAPWRFVIVDSARREALATLLKQAYLAEKPDAARLELDAMDQFAHQAPTLVVILSTPIADSKIPLWEQQLSAGAAAMNLLHAAHALGFVGGWLTGWAAYSDRVTKAFAPPDAGLGARIAGFVFIGTPSRPLDERPRPDYDLVVSRWGAET